MFIKLRVNPRSDGGFIVGYFMIFATISPPSVHETGLVGVVVQYWCNKVQFSKL